jgi:glycosyltransferase involved in cell wall biosynthesis
MLHRGDAVGRHTLHLRDLLAARQIASRIYVETIDPETQDECQLFSDYAEQAEPGDVLLYQFATASDIAPWLLTRPETLVVNYHNVTPPEHYASWDNGLARHQLRARAELAALAPRAALGIAVSAFNEAELRSAGFAATAVVPPAAMLPVEGITRSAVPAGAGGRWIAVGRMAPNKSIEHAVMALLVARAHHDPEATLQIVGRSVVPTYTRALHRFVDDMGLHHAVDFRGHVTDSVLAAAMASSDALIVTSAHEGFGVPVVEAMAMGLAVVANDAGALPEVVGAGGVLVDTSDPYALADAVASLSADQTAQSALAAAARAQLDSLDLGEAGERTVDLVARLR